MSKTNPEIPPFPMVVSEPGTLKHNTPWVQEMMTQFAVGAEVDVRIVQRRSLPQLKLYWSVLQQCVDNSDDKYGRAEDLHDALKIALGYSRRVSVIGSNEVIVLPGSIAFGRMTQGDFKIYFDKAMAQLDTAGYQAREFLEIAETKNKPTQSYRRGSNEKASFPDEIIWDDQEETSGC